MNIFYEIYHFFANGFSVLRHASIGAYKENSQEIDAIRQEMFSTPSNRHTDRENLKKDRMNVAHDVRRAFNGIALGNG